MYGKEFLFSTEAGKRESRHILQAYQQRGGGKDALKLRAERGRAALSIQGRLSLKCVSHIFVRAKVHRPAGISMCQ